MALFRASCMKQINGVHLLRLISTNTVNVRMFVSLASRKRTVSITKTEPQSRKQNHPLPGWTESIPVSRKQRHTQFLHHLIAPRTLTVGSSDPCMIQCRKLNVLSVLPTAAHPYAELMRLEKSIGTWLLYAPCTWSIALATPTGAGLDWSTMGLFGLGAIVMRGAGCTINDMWDSELDKKVRRTAGRPIASGRINHRQALAFLACQLSAGLAVLTQFDQTSFALGAASLGLVVAYPLMKRVTDFPQGVLGLTFNWGALLGYSCVTGGVWDLSIMLPLYVAGWSWTMVYDTIYAHQDKVDDIIVGIKSTALRFGDAETKTWLTGFGGLSVASLLLAGVNAEQSLYC